MLARSGTLGSRFDWLNVRDGWKGDIAAAKICFDEDSISALASLAQGGNVHNLRGHSNARFLRHATGSLR